MTLEEYMAVPYVLRITAARGRHGQWIRRAEYPEFPGCVGEGSSPEEAIGRLEECRARMVRERLERSESIPVPRSPLRRLLRKPAGGDGSPASGS